MVRAFGVFNEKEKGGIAYPSTFVLDRDRTVRFRSLDRTASRVELNGLFDFSGWWGRAPKVTLDPSSGAVVGSGS